MKFEFITEQRCPEGKKIHRNLARFSIYLQEKKKLLLLFPMSINEFVEMTIFLCLICFAIYDKMQGFVNESVLKNFIEIALSCAVSKINAFFAIYAEIQDGHQKRQENVCWEKLPVDSADALWVKSFVKIALSRSVSEINAFLCLTQKLRVSGKVEIALSLSVSEINVFLHFMHPKNPKVAGKPFLTKVASRVCIYPGGQKFCRNRSISLRFRDKRVFAFYAEIQDGHQKWRENNFCEKLPVHSTDTLWVKNFR